MKLLKATLNYLGINCWLSGHTYIQSIDEVKVRICSTCPKMQLKVNGKWITYKKEAKWLKKIKKWVE